MELTNIVGQDFQILLNVCIRLVLKLIVTNMTFFTARTQPFIMQVHFDGAELIIPPPNPDGSCPTCDFANTGFCLMYAQTPN